MTSLRKKASRPNDGAILSDSLSNPSSQVQGQVKDNPMDDSFAKHGSKKTYSTPNVIEGLKNHVENYSSAQSGAFAPSRNGTAEHGARDLPALPQHRDSEIIANLVSSVKSWI